MCMGAKRLECLLSAVDFCVTQMMVKLSTANYLTCLLWWDQHMPLCGTSQPSWKGLWAGLNLGPSDAHKQKGIAVRRSGGPNTRHLATRPPIEWARFWQLTGSTIVTGAKWKTRGRCGTKAFGVITLSTHVPWAKLIISSRVRLRRILQGWLVTTMVSDSYAASWQLQLRILPFCEHQASYFRHLWHSVDKKHGQDMLHGIRLVMRSNCSRPSQKVWKKWCLNSLMPKCNQCQDANP